MQVSNVSDDVVSSIATAHEAEAFTFANTPEAFSVFFASLYKDPLYALVREGLCNAWDAHIAASNTDTPLEITLEDGYLTIKDSGTGIPHRNIQKTYCTIGNSTKKADGKQTGGFGYGCKSPFAYTDNFEVTSHHNGEMVIYRMLRSDPNKEGFPSCNPIVALPTTHTGLTLKIPMPQHTFAEVQRIIRDVVYLGSIKATLNTEDLPALQMSFEDGEYCLFNPNLKTMYNSGTRVWVRYGNVVYPVHSFEDYADDYALATQFMGQLGNHSNDVHVIMQASPHTLAVTPSREELSMQDLTKKTLCNLLDVFLEKIPVEVHAEMDSVINTLTQFTGSALSHYKNIENRIPLTPEMHKEYLRICEEGVISNRRIVLSAVNNHSPIFKKHYREIFNKRVQYVLDNALPREKPIFQIWADNLPSIERPDSHDVVAYIPAKAMYHHYWRNAAEAWMSEPELRKKPLWVWQEHGDIRTPSEKSPPLQNITHTPPTYGDEYRAPFGATHNKVIIAFSKKSAFLHTSSFEFNRNITGALVYILPSKTIAIHQLALETFANAGYDVIDCTECEEVTTVKGKFVRTDITGYKVPQGGNPIFTRKGEILSLSNAIAPDGNLDILNYRRHTSPKYISKPEAIIRIPLNTGTSTHKLPYCSYPAKGVIAALGGCVGVVTTQPQAAKVGELKSIDELVESKCIEYIKSSPYFQRQLQVIADKQEIVNSVEARYTRRQSTSIYNSEVLRELFKVKVPKKVDTPSDPMGELTLSFLDNFKGSNIMEDLAAKFKPHPSVKRMANHIQNSMLLDLDGIHIDFEDMDELSDPDEKAIVASMVRLIMKKKLKE